MILKDYVIERMEKVLKELIVIVKTENYTDEELADLLRFVCLLEEEMKNE